MTNFTDQDLQRIIAGGESDCVEFKENLSGNAGNAIREAICAFANDLPNHRQPGLVFIGVREDGSVGSLIVSDSLLRQLVDMKTDGNIVPPPSLTVEKRNLDGRKVAVVIVQPSDSPPVRYRGIIHVRVGPRRGIATAQDERILNEKRRFGDRPFDLQPIPTANLTDLNLPQFQNEYLPQAISREALAANDRSLEEQLAATKMIAAMGQPMATVLGILTVGKNPEDFLPGAYVQFLRMDGMKLSDDVTDEEKVGGAFPDLLRRLDEKLRAHNRVAIAIPDHGTEQRTSLYPLEALQQVIRNAVMHRSYEKTYLPTRVAWFNDRVEVTSPGGAYGEVNMDNFGQPGLTDYRNSNLAEAMRNLGYVQRFGVGIPIVRKQLQAAGHPAPEFEVTSESVRVTVMSRAAGEP